MAAGQESGGISSIIYVIWLVFLAVYFFQGAVTGALRKKTWAVS